MPYKDKQQRLTYIAEWQKRNAEKVDGYKRKWKKDNREKIREQYRQQKLKVLSHYSNGKMVCDCCGDDHLEFLCIDHVNGGGTKHRRSIGHHDFYRYLVKENYPDGYRVLCHNCNASFGYYGYCPHKGSNHECLDEHAGSGD